MANDIKCSMDKEARKAYMKAYYKANPDKFKKRAPEKQAEYNEKRRGQYAASAEMRDATRAAVKAWQGANPLKRKAQRLRKYGIEPSDFLDMLTMQKGMCAICGHEDATNRSFFPVVDHCHESGRVRGLLCMNCNQGLGKFKDDPNRLFSAIAYLTKHG